MYYFISLGCLKLNWSFRSKIWVDFLRFINMVEISFLTQIEEWEPYNKKTYAVSSYLISLHI